jgi:hypothetical protein
VINQGYPNSATASAIFRRTRAPAAGGLDQPGRCTRAEGEELGLCGAGRPGYVFPYVPAARTP